MNRSLEIWPPGDPAAALRLGSDAPAPNSVAVLLWCAALAVLTDLAARSGVAGVAGFLAIAVAAAGLLSAGHVERIQAKAAAGAAVIFAAWLVVRASPWLLVPDVCAAIGLLAVAAGVASSADVFDLDLRAWIRRLMAGIEAAVTAPAYLARGLRLIIPEKTETGRVHAGRAASLARGLVVAAPVVLLLGALLRSADPVFAALLHVDIGGPDVLLHIVLLALGACAMAALFRFAATPREASPRTTARLGAAEAIVVLVLVDALFALFATAQVVALSGAADHVLRTAGLSYAEYARSGYFQLLWVSGLTLVLLLALDALIDRPATDTRLFGIAAALSALLTVVIGVVAYHRLTLYERAFGLTMLRLSAQVFAVWTIAVFGLLAARFFGVRRDRQWFVGAAASAGLVVLLVFNITNPEAVVARRDLRRGPQADAYYLTNLSDDATPTVVARLRDIPADAAVAYKAVVCTKHHPFRGWASYNLAATRAKGALAEICR